MRAGYIDTRRGLIKHFTSWIDVAIDLCLLVCREMFPASEPFTILIFVRYVFCFKEKDNKLHYVIWIIYISNIANINFIAII